LNFHKLLILTLAKGVINPNVSGIAQAIAEQAGKLEPNMNPPTICIFSKNK